MVSLTVTYFLLITTLIIIKSIQFYTKEIPERILLQIYLHSSKTRSASTEWIAQQGNTWLHSSEGEMSPTPAFYFRPLRRAWPFKFFISNISYIFEMFFWIILLPTTEASLTIQIYHYSNSDFHIDFVSESEPDQCYISYWIFIWSSDKLFRKHDFFLKNYCGAPGSWNSATFGSDGLDPMY